MREGLGVGLVSFNLVLGSSATIMSYTFESSIKHRATWSDLNNTDMKRALFLLGQLNDLDIEWMINNGHKDTIITGDILIHRDEPVDNLYIILSGQLSVRDGITNINEIAAVGPGEVLGEMSFLEARHPSVSVMAVESCEIFVISKSLIEQRMKMDIQFKSNFYYALALFLSNRLRKTTDQLGFGIPEETDVIDANVLDGVAQAGARFTKILKKFSEV